MNKTVMQTVRLGVAVLILHCVLALPNYPDGVGIKAFTRFQFELPVILLLVLLCPARIWVRAILALLVGIIFALKLADIATFSAFNRPFNPVIDLHLVTAGIDLMRQSIGAVLAWGAVIAAIILILGVIWALLWALRQWSHVSIPAAPAAAGVLAFAALAIADAGHTARIWSLPFNPPGTAVTTRVAYWHGKKTIDASIELAEFQTASREDPYADREGLFDLIGGRDVWVIFVESYGRASIDNPLYSTTHLPTLRSAQSDLAEAGLAMRSAWLTSPIAGGQSWLAHATLSSGLKIEDQSRYAAILASPRKTLFHLAQDAGFRTAAVMPAITIAWPEVELMGFDHVLPAADLGYEGKAFNWVTMPDQYTLSVFGTLLPPDRRPDFVQIALISSHAPWVPVPEMIDWEDVGDGTVFNEMAMAGDPPKLVWRDRDRVRDQYRQAVDYSLQAVMEFAARQEDPPVMVILGDHPAAGFVSQVEGTDVPVHIVAPPEIAPRLDAWGWSDGLIPADDAPVWPMEAFRDQFIEAFTSDSERPRS